jgi:hypothetical protein
MENGPPTAIFGQAADVFLALVPEKLGLAVTGIAGPKEHGVGTEPLRRAKFFLRICLSLAWYRVLVHYVSLALLKSTN